MTRKILYHPGTGTVVSADEILVVDLDKLEAMLDMEDADVQLSEGDDEVQTEAMCLGEPLKV